jgi:hypothetical protein
VLFDFYIDFDGELDVLHDMLAGDVGNVDRAAQYGIPSDIAAKVKPGKKCPALKSFLKKSYGDFEAELSQSLAFHKKYFKKSPICAKLEKIVGHKIPTYTVRLNVQTGGISNWRGTDISINAFDYLRNFKGGFAEQALVWESMLSQAFQDIRRKYGGDYLDDYNVWGISELTAVAIYQTDFFASDWPIGYPQLEPRRRNLKKLYQARKNWPSYLDAAVASFKKRPLEKTGKEK